MLSFKKSAYVHLIFVRLLSQGVARVDFRLESQIVVKCESYFFIIPKCYLGGMEKNVVEGST